MANLIDQYHEASSRAGTGGRVAQYHQRAVAEPVCHNSATPLIVV